LSLFSTVPAIASSNILRQPDRKTSWPNGAGHASGWRLGSLLRQGGKAPIFAAIG